MVSYRLILTLLATTGLCEAFFWYRQRSGRKKDRFVCQLLRKVTFSSDCFSSLPDEIIKFILSSLSLKEAAATSVLSRRWRYIHASLPNLNFDSFTFFSPYATYGAMDLRHDFCKPCVNKFVQVVDLYIKSYAGPKLFSLRIAFCYQSGYARNVNRWINWATKMGVEQLDLNFVCRDFPGCQYIYVYSRVKMYVFSFEQLCKAPMTLKHLHLHSCILQPPPPSCKLCTLTTLDLNYISLAHGELDSMLSSCLNLEWLGLKECSLPSKLCILGLSRLKFLSVSLCSGQKEIEISAKNLTTFEFVGVCLSKMFFRSVPKLENACIFTCAPDVSEQSTLSSLAEDLPQLKEVSITYTHLKGLCVFFTPFTVIPFTNVLHLDFFMVSGNEYTLVPIIIPLLRAFPLLQSFYLKLPSTVWCTSRMKKKEWGYFHTQLREVEIGNFQENPHNIEFAACLLQVAAALRQVTLCLTDRIMDMVSSNIRRRQDCLSRVRTVSVINYGEKIFPIM